MAELLKVNGNTVAPSQQVGRDLVFIGIEAANTVLNDAVTVGGSVTNLDLVRQVIDSASSITLIGEVSSGEDDVMFMVEGLGFGGPGSGVEPDASAAVSLQDQINAIRDSVEALNSAALGTTVCTIQHIEGVVFVVDFTDT